MTRLRLPLIAWVLSLMLAAGVATIWAAGPAADKVAAALRQFSLDHPADGTLFVTWNTEVPTPKSLQNFKSAPGQGTPESVARQFLNRHADLFLLKAPMSDLRVTAMQESLTAYHVRFQQMVGDVPVYGGEISVHMTKRLEVETVHNAYFPVENFSTTAAVPEAEARRIAETQLGLEALAGAVRTQLYVYTLGGRPALVWQVLLPASRPLGDWEYIVDAQTGAVLEARDRARYATAQARIFDPNPVVTLRNPGFRDQGHSGTAIPPEGYLSRTLQDITITSGGRLQGPWVNTTITCRNTTYTGCRALQNFDGSLNYNFLRNDLRFEELMAYYHIDAMQRYIQSLGFNNIVHRSMSVDPHVNGDDNSFYRFSDQTLNFGDGGVFDAEDAEIISHEYGHAIQDSQVRGFPNPSSAEAGSIGEGWGDFWSVNFHSAVSGGFQDACVGDWDATSYSRENPPCLRRVDRNKHYPESLVGEIHLDGEIWSQALWDIRQSIGRDDAAKLFLEANFRFSPAVSFREAANLVVATATALFGGRYDTVVRSSLQRRGLLIGGPPTFTTYFPLFLNGQFGDANDIYTTGLAVYNPSPEGATLQFAAHGPDGQAVGSTATRFLDARSQQATFAADLFGLGGTDRRGWVEVTSDKEIKGFFLIMDGGVARVIDGTDVSSMSNRELIFMHAEANPDTGLNTYYSIANPNPNTVNGTFTLYLPDGTTAGSPFNFQIVPKGEVLVSLRGSGRGGYGRVSCDQPVVGMQIFGNTTRLAALKAVTPDTSAMTLFFPHFAAGGGWGTDVALINTTANRADLLIFGLRNDGTAIGDGPVIRHLDPNQELLESVNSLFTVGGGGLEVGYLRVESSVPGLVGFTYFTYNNGEASAVPLSYQPSRTLTFSHVAHNFASGSGHLFATGVALVNPSTTAAALYSVSLYSGSGGLVGSRSLRLGPQQKDARAINDILGMSLPTLGNGYIVVTSDMPLFGFELFYTDDAGMISAVPAQ